MEEIKIFKLENEFLKIELLNLGAVIKRIRLKDKNGDLKNVVLGYDNIENYRENPAYLGAIIGRTAGRIKNGKLKILDKIYQLEINNGENNLHGGINSISHKFWSVEPIERGYRFSIKSSHLENSYPANVEIKVDYILEKNQLLINYSAKSDRATYINLTNHSYFNLSGDSSTTIYKDILHLNSNYLVAIDKNSIPKESIALRNSIFDFTNPKRIENFFGKENNETFSIQRELANNGIDHPFIFDENKKSLELKNENTGIKLKVETDNPAVVIYTANYLQDIGFKKHSAICFETQEVPDLYIDEKLNIAPCFIDENTGYKKFTKFIFEVQ